MNSFQNRPSVLIVDDRWEDTFLLQRLIRATKTAHPVHTASGARQAIDWLRLCVTHGEAKPCLILLDVGVPPGSGFAVLRWVRETESLNDVAVVMLSASDEPSLRQEASNLGAQGYLLKYPSSQTLGEVIETAAQSGRLHRIFPGFQPEAGRSLGHSVSG